MKNSAQAVGSDQVEQLLVEAYGPMRLRAPVDRPPGLRITSSQLDGVRLDQAAMRMRVDLDIEPPGTIIVAALRGGRARYRWGAEEHTFGMGEVFLAGQPVHPYTAALEDVTVELTVMDPTLLEQVAQQAGDDRGAIRFTGYPAVSARAAQQWRSTYAYVRAGALGNTDLPRQSLVLGAATRLLAATALTTFPNTAHTGPQHTDRRDGHPRTLRRAITFIEANAHRDITLADMAQACAVTIRTIQLAFRRHLDTTPLAYLRRVRLEHAHDELRAGDPDELTVGTVATRWGYLDASRFAAHYRQTFFELPSQTLRR